MAVVSFGAQGPNSGPLTEQRCVITIFLHDHVRCSTDMHRHHISSGAHEALGDGHEETSEFVEAMRAIWNRPLASYTGENISFTDTEIDPQPLQRPDRLLVGGRADVAAGRTGRVGDGRLPGWLSPAEMTCGAKIARQTAEQDDSKPDGTGTALRTQVHLLDDGRTHTPAIGH